MTAPRDDLHTDLLAALEASPELSPEDRRHLADIFLDSLESRYQLLPRTASHPGAGMAASIISALRSVWPVLAVAAAVLLALPLLFFTVFLAVHILPFVLIGMLIVFWMRSGRGRRWHGRRSYWF